MCCQVLAYVHSIYIIWVKDIEKLVYGCVSPRGSYVPKGVISFNFFITKVNSFMIILAKYEEQLRHGYVRPR